MASPLLPRLPTYAARLMRFGYILSALICTSAGCGRVSPPPSISSAELQSYLQPLPGISVYAGYDPKVGLLYMGNDLIERRLYLNANSRLIQTVRYTYKPSPKNYVDGPSEEFRFRIGELVFSGESNLLTYDTYQIKRQAGGAKRITIQLTYNSEEESAPIFRLWLHYEVYPNLPLICKWLSLENLTDTAFFIQEVVVESIPFFATRAANLQILKGDMSGRPGEILLSEWEGMQTPTFVVLQDRETRSGVLLGNESAGILKHYQAYFDRHTVSIGMNPTSAINRPEIRVPPGRLVNTPKVWTTLFEGTVESVMNADIVTTIAPSVTWPRVHRWTRSNSGWHIPADTLQQKNTTVFDYDWHIENVDRFKKIGQQAVENGKMFGIRLPIATIHPTVLKRPEWGLTPVPVFLSLPDLAPENTEKQTNQSSQGLRKAEEHQPDNHETEQMIYCVLSDYGYYLTQAVRTLLKETGADLLVLDGPILGKPESLLKGCDALGHQHYTREQSIDLIYRWLFEFADYLHQEFPDLQLGITATAYGIARPDIACSLHFDLFLYE